MFKNWNTQSNGGGSPYVASTSYTVNSDLKLYAQWYTPSTISPDANGGTLASGCSNLSKVYNQQKQLWAANLNPSRANYSFVEWNTSQNGAGDSYAPGSYYPADKNASVTLYAQWAQVYDSPLLSISKSYRCSHDGTPNDEGACAAVECTFQIWDTGTNAVDSMSCTVSCPGDESYTAATQYASRAQSIARGINEWTRDLTESGSWLVGQCKFVVSASLDTENSYQVSVTLADEDGGSPNSDGTVTRKSSISAAFYTIDVLGDRFLYNLTEDTALDQDKTYYVRSGSGMEGDPYVYEVVDDPDVSDIASYYEANGMRPGHGVTFFGVSKQEGLHIHNVADNSFGNVTGFNGDESGVITIHSNILDVTDNPASTVVHRLLVPKDKNERVMGAILARRYPASNVMVIEAHANRSSDNASVYNGIDLIVDDNGTRRVYVSESLPWRNALGASSGIWPISIGGTGTSNYLAYVSDDHATVSVATGTWTQLASVTLAAGKWLIISSCYAAQNSSGSRQFVVSSSTSVSAAVLGYSIVRAGGSFATYEQFPLYVTPASQTTYRTFGYQSSGGALNMRVSMRAVRLG